MLYFSDKKMYEYSSIKRDPEDILNYVLGGYKKEYSEEIPMEISSWYKFKKEVGIVRIHFFSLFEY